MSATMTLAREPETTNQAEATWYGQFKESYTTGGFRAIYDMWQETRLESETARTRDTEHIA